MSQSIPQAAALKLAAYFKQRATDRADEGTSVQLAYLVLAQYCEHEAYGERGGPTDEMVACAENTAGEYLDEKVRAAL